MSPGHGKAPMAGKLGQMHHAGNDEEKQGLLEGPETAAGHEDDSELLRKEKRPHREHASKSSFASGLIWMTINTLATIGIVFTNKAIFSDPSSLKLAQLSFACFHFFITWLTLFVLSRPSLALFVPRRVPLLDILPLSLAMSLNVILPNLSLAFSTVTFYQVARILLTPTVAILNYLLHGATLPPPAIVALVPACTGVALLSYYDTLPPPGATTSTTTTTTIIIPPITNPTTTAHQTQTQTATTSPLGVLFALAGILASSLYTVWIASYRRRLRLSSMQLLYNQAPVSAALLLYAIPFVDTFPSAKQPAHVLWRGSGGGGNGSGDGDSDGVGGGRRVGAMVLLSAGFAALINISQFFVVARAGPVSSTVVGHVKTCAIVALGWAISGRGLGVDGRAVGVVVALGGIIAYSVIMLREKETQTARRGAKR